MATKKLSAFQQKFKEERAKQGAGGSFDWEGKKIGLRYAEETPAKKEAKKVEPKKAPAPKPTIASTPAPAPNRFLTQAEKDKKEAAGKVLSKSPVKPQAEKPKQEAKQEPKLDRFSAQAEKDKKDSAEKTLKNAPVTLTGMTMVKKEEPKAPKKKIEVGQEILKGGETVAKKLGVPAQVRIFGSTVLGRKDPITERDFTKEELGPLKKAAEKVTKEGRSDIQYKDYPGNRDRKDLPVGSMDKYSKKNAMEFTVGRANVKKDEKGKTKVVDTYDFENPQRHKELDRIEAIRKKEGKWGVVKDTGKKLAGAVKEGKLLVRAPDIIGNAAIGRRGRPVEIKLRSGGMVRGHGCESKGRTKGKFR